MTCSVPGMGTFVRSRYCHYDPLTGLYALKGYSYECDGKYHTCFFLVVGNYFYSIQITGVITQKVKVSVPL